MITLFKKDVTLTEKDVTLTEKGVTLIELAAVLAIVGVIAAFGTPYLKDTVASSQRAGYRHELISSLMFARGKAISLGLPVTLCPLDSSGQCTDDWSKPISIFKDPERQHQLLSKTHLIRVVTPPTTGYLIVGTGIQNYFAFRATGIAREAIGHLTWCPNSGKAREAFQILINMGGRARFAIDTNEDGVVEASSGAPISCSLNSV